METCKTCYWRRRCTWLLGHCYREDGPCDWEPSRWRPREPGQDAEEALCARLDGDAPAPPENRGPQNKLEPLFRDLPRGAVDIDFCLRCQSKTDRHEVGPHLVVLCDCTGRDRIPTRMELDEQMKRSHKKMRARLALAEGSLERAVELLGRFIRLGMRSDLLEAVGSLRVVEVGLHELGLAAIKAEEGGR